MQNKNISGSLYFPERINTAMSLIYDYPLTIVEAPMGYGKTTAVREYLNKSDAKVMWQKIYDNSITAFWSGFCILFDNLDPDCSKSLLQLGFPNDSTGRHEMLRILEKIDYAKPIVIVLDDYHHINTTDTNKLIEFLVLSEIPNLYMVITSRFMEFANFEELKIKGFINHISKETLEFHPKDIAKYYKLCGITIKSAEADELYLFTEGWISALYLLMLKYDMDKSYMFKADIYTLIDKVVYTPFPENYKDLLIAMCIFDSFTNIQAAYVCDVENTSLILDDLVSKNAFVNYDIKDNVYSMHSILKIFMKKKLENKEQLFKNKLYENAAKWYIKNEEYLTSMQFAYLAGNFDLLLTSLELDKGRSINSEYKDLVIKYFDECPIDLKKRYPMAMLVFLRKFFTYNETGMFKKACGEFMINFNNMDDSDDDYKERLLGEYELLLSFTGYNDISKMSEYHRRACNLLKEPSTILDVKNSWTFGSPSVLYMFYRKSGELENEIEAIKESMPYYYKVTSGHGQGAELVMEAERYYNLGIFEDSEITAYKSFQFSNENSHSGILICSVFLQMRLAFMKGNLSEIIQLINNMRSDINSKKLYMFMHTMDMCESYIYSYLNIKENISVWISNGEFKNTRLLFPSMGFLNIVYGRVLLINGEYLKLIAVSEHFINISSVFPNILGQIYTYIYVAAANRLIYRQTESMESLKTALDLAMIDKVYMPFVENCDYIKSMLEDFYSQGIYKDEISKILKLYEPYKKSSIQIHKDYFSGNKLKLTEREAAIARLASEGFSNKRIGEKLFISENTVKTQLKNIFEKLGVNSRSLLKQYINKEF